MTEPPPPPYRERRWIPLLGVLAVILFVTFGGYVVAGPLEEPGPPSPGPVPVVPGVSLTPLPGWENTGAIEVPVGDTGDVLLGSRFVRGAGNLDVFGVEGFGGTPEDLYFGYVFEVLQPDSTQLRSSEVLDPMATDQGLRGVRGYYLGTFTGVAAPIEGEVSAIIGPEGMGVVVDGWAPEGQLTRWIEEIRQMVRSAEVT